MRSHVDTVAPMLATSATDMPSGAGWAFEPKYDGIRVLALVTPTGVRLQSRNGIDKATQFPEIGEALRALATDRQSSFVLDGEIVSGRGKRLGRFESLQARIHMRDATAIALSRTARPATLVLFDILRSGASDYLDAPWTERRAALVELASHIGKGPLQLGAATIGGGARLLARATRAKWEGIMAKRIDSRYAAGARSNDWRKIKIGGQQEFVVGGWTEPRGSRQFIGALLLGVWEGNTLRYAGHVGGGFSQDELAALHRRLRAIEEPESPFAVAPVTNQPAHWARPVLVAEVRFNEWTLAGRLRQPTYLGLRLDKAASDVQRETLMRASGSASPEPPPERTRTKRTGAASSRRRRVDRHAPAIIAALDAIEQGGDEGVLDVAGDALTVTNLSKIYFPKAKQTKGDLLRYYATIAPQLLPHIAGRPLVLRRYPGGVGKAAFFQQHAPEDAPSGVQTALVARADDAADRRVIGGTLMTLLYCAQLGGIDMNPWHSRVESLDIADYSVIDLDPGPGATFARVVDVARWVQDALAEFGLHGAVKTSGASGIHIYVPLPRRTPYESSLLLAQLIATHVAVAHPRQATVQRSVKLRPRGTVYVDYLQNIRGKSIASVFSVRAQPGASVSAPLAWSELDSTLDARDFTMPRLIAEAAERDAIWRADLAHPVRLDRLLTDRESESA